MRLLGELALGVLNFVVGRLYCASGMAVLFLVV